MFDGFQWLPFNRGITFFDHIFSEFELGSLAEGECGADLVDGAVEVSFSEDTDMSLGQKKRVYT